MIKLKVLAIILAIVSITLIACSDNKQRTEGEGGYGLDNSFEK
jgi:hypothetical protein